MRLRDSVNDVPVLSCADLRVLRLSFMEMGPHAYRKQLLSWKAEERTHALEDDAWLVYLIEVVERQRSRAEVRGVHERIIHDCCTERDLDLDHVVANRVACVVAHNIDTRNVGRDIPEAYEQVQPLGSKESEDGNIVDGLAKQGWIGPDNCEANCCHVGWEDRVVDH